MQRRARTRFRVVPIVLALFAGLSVAVLGAASDHASAAVTKTVNIVEFSYSPATVTVNVGDTVKWVHDGTSTSHSVTADGGSFDSSPGCTFSAPSMCLGANATFSHTFTKAGTFRYYCRIHGAPGGMGMSGVVIVKGATSHPTIASVKPATVKHGTSKIKVTVTGTQFATGFKVKISGTGVSITSPKRVDAAHLTMLVTTTATAPKTARNVTVTNPDGGTVTKAGALKVT